MSDDSSNLSDLRIETGSRARELPQEAHLRKRFGKFQDFVDGYSSRISLGGIFVDSEVLQPVGGQVYLDFRLEDGYRLLHGLGEVVWVRLKTLTTTRLKGMGVRFLSLDESGRELVLKLLEEQVKSGGAPFEVDRVPDDGSIDPTVVQALAGPSAEEHLAASQAGRTGGDPGGAADDDDDLPELPPGVLPPPDDEPDFSAPWGEQLPEIPDDLLDEPSSSKVPVAGQAAGAPSIPSVEAPASLYAPGSDSDEPPVVDDFEQADFDFQPPGHAEDPHLDESDFGATERPKLKAVGGTTTLQQAQDPFGDFDGGELPEVDGTLFQLPNAGRAGDDDDLSEPAESEPSRQAPHFGGAGGFDAGAGFGGGFDAGFDSGGFDTGGFDAGGFDAAGFGDDSSSQVMPPADIGEAAGAAWRTGSDPGTVPPAPSAASAWGSPAPPAPTDAAPPPTPQEMEAMDAAMDIDGGDSSADDDLADDGLADDGFAFEPPDEDLLEPPTPASDFDESGWSTGDGTAGVRHDGIDATHAAVSSFDDSVGIGAPSPPPAAAPAAPTSFAPANPATDTADDLFAFRGPADAQPAVDLEETASIRGSALPELSDTIMGTKPVVAHDDGDLTGSYDDWHEWAPHPTRSGGKGKVIVGIVLLLALAGGAGYVYRDTLMTLVGRISGGGTSSAADGADLGPSPAVADSAADAADSQAADDPLAEPVEGIDLDEFLDESAGEGTAEEPTTQADAASLRPASTRREPPPPQTSPPKTSPPPQTSPPPPTTTRREPPPPAASTGRPARLVQSIQVRSSGPGTEVIVSFDGNLASNRYSHDTLSWAADREMVTLRGIGNFEQTEVRGNTAELLRVRVGYHPGDELRLVFDKTSGAVAIRGIEARGNQLVIRLST